MTNHERRIVLCLDGTWNNPYQLKERDDAVIPASGGSPWNSAPLEVIKVMPAANCLSSKKAKPPTL